MEEKSPKPYINVDFFENLTGEIEEPQQRDSEEIGLRIRTIREQRRLSLEELANLLESVFVQLRRGKVLSHFSLRVG